MSRGALPRLFQISVFYPATAKSWSTESTIADFTIVDNDALLIDVEVTGDQNIKVEEIDNLLKYTDPQVWSCGMWDFPATLTLEELKESQVCHLFRNLLLFGTANILKKILSVWERVTCYLAAIMKDLGWKTKIIENTIKIYILCFVKEMSTGEFLEDSASKASILFLIIRNLSIKKQSINCKHMK